MAEGASSYNGIVWAVGRPREITCFRVQVDESGQVITTSVHDLNTAAAGTDFDRALRRKLAERYGDGIAITVVADGGAVWSALAELATTPGIGIQGAWQALLPAGCAPGYPDCVRQAMADSRASDAAVQYDEMTGYPLLEFWSIGPVDLGLESHVCGTCPPGVWVLLNGLPGRVHPACGSDCVATAGSSGAVDPLPLPGEPDVQTQFDDLSAVAPELLAGCGAPYMELEADWADPATGGQVFLFQQRLSGPPAGCTGAPGYRVRFVATFEPDGTYTGVRDVGFCTDPDPRFSVPGEPALPLPACPMPGLSYDAAFEPDSGLPAAMPAAP